MRGTIDTPVAAGLVLLLRGHGGRCGPSRYPAGTSRVQNAWPHLPIIHGAPLQLGVQYLAALA